MLMFCRKPLVEKIVSVLHTFVIIDLFITVNTVLLLL